MVVLPVMQLLLFGYAINTDVRHIPTVVFDQDHSAESRDLVRSAGGDRLLRRGRRTSRDYDEIERALRAGARARRAGRSRRASARDLRRGRAGAACSSSSTAPIRRRSPARPTPRRRWSRRARRELVGQRACARAARAPVAAADQLEPTTWYNPELRTAVYVVPGLVGVILTMTMVMLTAMAIARERERGTLEQLIVSPVAARRARWSARSCRTSSSATCR